MRFIRLLFAVAALLMSAVPCAAAGETARALHGVALVIGEARYRGLPALANAGRDAQAVAQLLNGLGFEVTTVADRDARKLRRDLDAFVADAEAADAALLFYSGHGIEAGGENWLVPVDADATALEDAERRLVALGPVLAALKGSVPLSLVFLDACRSDPFPPGAVLRRAGVAEAISSNGLGVPRGMIAVTTPAAAQAVGSLIGFAAAPGEAALDGPPGADSPYTAALLRHLGAAGETELGQVMRMVTEEVYLKTEGRQRPWVNESLTGLLYLGAPAAAPPPDEGRILTERRQLLLTIASLPEQQRRQVEAAARSAKVPMDALYGLLRSLGVAAPADPEALARLLEAQAERLRAVLAERQALHDADPEIERLSRLADQALREGALDASIGFWDRARARFAEVSQALDATEAELKARRLEGGALLMRAAEAHELAADYRVAAETYLAAFEQVEKWDARAAWNSKRRAGNAWLSQGDVHGDAAALDRAAQLLGEALALAPREAAALDWGLTQSDLGNVLLLKAQRSTGTEGYGAAIAAMKLALEVRSRERQPRLWARTQNNLALALGDLAFRTHDTALREEAIAAFRAALSETPRAADPDTWATIMDNLGNALSVAGPPHLEEAVAAHRAALDVRERARVPLDWARSQINLGNALAAMGQAKADVALIDQSIAAYRLALEEQSRERLPQPWASLHYNIGTSHLLRGEASGRSEDFRAAAAAFRQALEVRRFEAVPVEWAETQYNLGRALQQAGHLEQDVSALRDSVAAYERSLRYYSRTERPAEWADTEFNIGNVLSDLATAAGDAAARTAAIAAFREVLTVRDETASATAWADTQFDLGNELRRQGTASRATAPLREAAAAYRAALRVYTPGRNAREWADTAAPLAEALSQIGTLAGEAAAFQEAIAIFDAVLPVYEAAETARERAHAMQYRADTQYNFGLLLRRQALAAGDAAKARQAAAAFRAALAYYTRERDAGDWADTEVQLADALNNLRLIAPDRAVLDEAVAAYRAALEVLGAESQGALWSKAKLGLSLALYGQGVEAKSPQLLRQGRAEALAVADYYTRRGEAAERDRLAGQLALFDAALAELAP